MNHVDYYERGRLSDGQEFCPFATRNLREIVKITGAKIVVSSTWRKRGFRKIKKLLQCYDLGRYCIGVTPIIDDAERGQEIQKWISDFEIENEPLESFAILDDDADMCHLSYRLVQTSPYKQGLNNEKRDETIKMLELKLRD
jgi:hypothetical protein